MILSKFLMYRVSEQYNLPNCQNNFAFVKILSCFEVLKFLPKMLKQNILEKKYKNILRITPSLLCHDNISISGDTSRCVADV